MPIIDKRDRNNWYNTLPISNQNPWEHFSADRLQGNEIECGDATLAKIPQIPGRISHKNVRNGDFVTRYVELILERTYDREKHQSRNKRVTIGIDVSHIYRGMMIINDKYHDYFDRKGNLIWTPPEPEDPEQLSEEQTEQTNQQQETEQQTEEQTQPHTPPQAAQQTQPQIQQQTKQQPQTEQKTEEQLLQDVDTLLKELEMKTKGFARPAEPKGSIKEAAPYPEPYTNETNLSTEETDSMDQDLDRELQEELNRKERERDHLEFLNSMLNQYKEIVDEQSNRHPERPLSRYQIHRINELLRELKDFFSPFETDSYLQLAKEPDENDPDDTPMTYGDMSILLTSYSCTLLSYRLNRLWYKG